MRFTTLLFAALSLAAAPAVQAQETGAVFRPTGNWTADFGDDYCRLIRTFSDGKDTLSLAFERTQPSEFVRLIFVGDGLKLFRSADQLGYRFLPAGGAGKSRFVRSETADKSSFLAFDPVLLAPVPAPSEPPPAGAMPVFPPYSQLNDSEAARLVTAVELSEGLTTPVRIEFGSLTGPISVMQSCTDDLLKVWGLDPDKHRGMSALAVPNPEPGGVLPMGTIPFADFAKLVGGANQVRLIVGADGKPGSCTIYQPSLSASLNERICRMLMDKATFQPAKDAEGAPMASYWMGPPLAFGPPPPPGFGR